MNFNTTLRFKCNDGFIPSEIDEGDRIGESEVVRIKAEMYWLMIDYTLIYSRVRM